MVTAAKTITAPSHKGLRRLLPMTTLEGWAGVRGWMGLSDYTDHRAYAG
jgi:hypothetical protein